MKQNSTILVVGGNAAGPAAAAKAKRTNPSSNVILFEKSPFISTGTCELPYLISNEIKNYEDLVFYSSKDFQSKKGVEVYTNHLVDSIDRKAKNISVKNLKDSSVRKLDYDKLILTTGSSANYYPYFSTQIENAFTLKSVADYLLINQYISNNNIQNVLIIGAGYIGLEVADAFLKINKDVTIIDQAAKPLSTLDEMVQDFILADISTKVETYFSCSPKFNIDNNLVKSAEIEGRLKNYDLVIVATGIIPNNYLCENSGLEIGKSGGLKIDRKMKTSDPNIYAAGDNVELKNRITYKSKIYPFATLAHEGGHIAGCNAAGGNMFMDPIIPNFSLSIFDNAITSVGLTESEAQSHFRQIEAVDAVGNNLVPVMPNSRKVFGKVIFDKNNKRILGASFIGGNEVSGYSDLIASMIYFKNDARELSKLNYNYTPKISPFKNLLSILGRKIEGKI